MIMPVYEKPYEVWEGDHYKFVSRHDELEEAHNECKKLNKEANRDYFVMIKMSRKEHSELMKRTVS
jgi:hypothetical protein